jgi:hypothetical protein
MEHYPLLEEFGMKKTSLVLALALFCAPAFAEDGGGKWGKRLWRASLAAVAAGSIVDLQSSLGKHETNGLLANRQGIFSMQGVGIKLAVAGAAVGTQHYLLHKHPAASVYKTGALINFAVAGALGGIAVHNYGTRPVQ